MFAVDSSVSFQMPAEFDAFLCAEGQPDYVVRTDDSFGKDPIIPWLLEDKNLRSVLLEHRSAVLHASYVVCAGKALLFTAPSGTGKSTQANLWAKYRGAQIVNGDRALIQKTDAGFTANGIFYSGSSGCCQNITAPVDAVVVLDRGNAEITRLNGVEIVKAVLPQLAYDTAKPQDIIMASDLLSEMAAEVPFCRLSATMDERSVEALEKFRKG